MSLARPSNVAEATHKTSLGTSSSVTKERGMLRTQRHVTKAAEFATSDAAAEREHKAALNALEAKTLQAAVQLMHLRRL